MKNQGRQYTHDQIRYVIDTCDRFEGDLRGWFWDKHIDEIGDQDSDDSEADQRRMLGAAKTLYCVAKDWGLNHKALTVVAGAGPTTLIDDMLKAARDLPPPSYPDPYGEDRFVDFVNMLVLETKSIRLEAGARSHVVIHGGSAATEPPSGRVVADLCDRLITDLRDWMEMAGVPFHKVSLEEADRLGPVIERIEADLIHAIRIAREVGVEVSLLPLLAGSIRLDGARDLQAAGAKLVVLGPDVDPEDVNWWELGIRTGVAGLERELKRVRTEALVGVPAAVAKGDSLARELTPAKVDPSPTPPVPERKTAGKEAETLAAVLAKLTHDQRTLIRWMWSVKAIGEDSRKNAHAQRDGTGLRRMGDNQFSSHVVKPLKDFGLLGGIERGPKAGKWLTALGVEVAKLAGSGK